MTTLSGFFMPTGDTTAAVMFSGNKTMLILSLFLTLLAYRAIYARLAQKGE